MSFFKKLKAKLFKSSAKLEAGLEAIVDEKLEPEAQVVLNIQETKSGHLNKNIDVADQENISKSDRATPPFNEIVEVKNFIPSSLEAPVSEEPNKPLDVDTKSLNPLPEKTGIFARTPRRLLDDDMLEQLEELLISSDMGVDTAVRITANLAEGRFGKKLSTADIKMALSQEIVRVMEPVARPLPIYEKTPQVILVVGVNGSGKTTTIGKLASQFKKAGKSVVIAAGDTFRAAAVEQLKVWGDRAGVPVLTAPQGSDPASLAFDAMTQAENDGVDLLMIDTAGRLQNRTDLMEELAKIVRVIKKKDPTAPHNTLLVLDATTGQNTLNQVEVFQKLADVSGLIMTKLDGTAKGGVLVSLADKFALPIHAIGVGEQIDDLDAFDPQDFANALTGS
ncbi:signal recognition particle-docking protein FtsY [Planktomarina sp.]|nr:signal recognition particle-docking protein FtsY [Planktomarina sp.]MDA9099761.1 signal recognition particle-docking protein FtsY [Planktomarina sp.]